MCYVRSAIIRLIKMSTCSKIIFELIAVSFKSTSIWRYESSHNSFLGGGTFDVSVGRIIDGELKILGINGDTHLGQ